MIFRNIEVSTYRNIELISISRHIDIYRNFDIPRSGSIRYDIAISTEISIEISISEFRLPALRIGPTSSTILGVRYQSGVTTYPYREFIFRA